ncbi:hypothetical protein M409DRAFT_67443 [Zasmidium cellare ATCC 36951]|uniref:Class II aldolase/adducin N-terminal domain-containing protein n=1 Tax=Zasmidium cellare ATCC 36951 TaxID=1080233 RepID=A0A6A6CDA5_ZASCE|nr:uncharacterized protein M409DRAFT_67443 [Zasmidium cellare ATCC 36951]KAF2165174.1 hypothetical protein M409DRAFT_67443 [Zasmidium cellare ATCC 36951]
MATALSTTDPVLKQAYRDFITGCHILHYHKVLDAYGHLSIRHPHNPDHFIMSRYIAPATIASENDLIEYHVSNAEPVGPTSTKGYSERCIHSEIYKRYESVNAVVHSHSPEIVPYSMSGVPLKPCFHMAGFLGTRTPVWDIAKCWQEGDERNFLVSNTRLGASLAERFEGDSISGPELAAVLMRGHGLTVQAGNVIEAVAKAVYTQTNAAIQTTALVTWSSYLGLGAHSGDVPEMAYLDEDEAEGAAELMTVSSTRAWRLWAREVEAAWLYVNSIA